RGEGDERVEQSRRGIDDRTGVMLVRGVSGGRVFAPVVGRQHDVLAEPERFESGRVGGPRHVDELGAGDVVRRQPDAHAHPSPPCQRLLSALLPPTITAMTTPMAVTNDITRAMAATSGYPPLPQ